MQRNTRIRIAFLVPRSLGLLGVLSFFLSTPGYSAPIVGFSFFHELGITSSASNPAIGDSRKLYAHTLGLEFGYKPTKNLLVGIVGQNESYVQLEESKDLERIPLLGGKTMSFGPTVDWRNDDFFVQLQYTFTGALTLNAPPKVLNTSPTDSVKDYSFTGMSAWKARGGVRLFGVLYLHGFLSLAQFSSETWGGADSAKAPIQVKSSLSPAVQWITLGIGTAVIF